MVALEGTIISEVEGLIKEGVGEVLAEGIEEMEENLTGLILGVAEEVDETAGLLADVLEMEVERVDDKFKRVNDDFKRVDDEVGVTGTQAARATSSSASLLLRMTANHRESCALHLDLADRVGVVERTTTGRQESSQLLFGFEDLSPFFLRGLRVLARQRRSEQDLRGGRGDCATCDQLCAEPPLSLPHLNLTHSDSSSRPSWTTRARTTRRRRRCR